MSYLLQHVRRALLSNQSSGSEIPSVGAFIGGDEDPVGSPSILVPSTITVGSRVIVAGAGASAAAITVTDSKGHTYTLHHTEDDALDYRVRLFSAQVTTPLIGGVDTIDLSAVSRTGLAMWITGSVLDQVEGAQAAGTNFDSGATPATTAPALVVGLGLAFDSGANDPTATGYTFVGEIEPAPTSFYLAFMSKTAPIPGAQSFAGSFAHALKNAAICAAFK